MQRADAQRREECVLVLAPTPRDAQTSQALLAGDGLTCVLCLDLAALCRQIESGAGAAVLTEEALAADRDGRLAEVLRCQPPWSDLPLILLTGGGADSPVALAALGTLGNVTLLERPVRIMTLVSAVRAALRARRRQYQVRDHLAERERTAEALREADHRKDAFLAQLAHELRGPLGALVNALHLIGLQAEVPAVQQAGELAERQVQQLAGLVDDLLDVSRIARGRVELKKEAVDASRVVARAVETVRPLIESRRHRLTVLFPAQPPRLEADPARLVQVLVNLLTNAARYTEPGGSIYLTAERDGGDVLFRVRDTGVGLSPDLLPGLFEPFVQGRPGSHGGLGLGLALVRGLAELHGGSVVALSGGPGEGSEFVVRLPGLPPEAGKQLKVREAAPGPKGPSRRVLVVDDNVDAAQSLKLLLELWGHEVRVAHDGHAAVEAARAFGPEVVLLDLGLPGPDGYEVARRLRELPGGEAACLVALTGYGREEDRSRSAEAGLQAHLVKPADPATLRGLLTQAGPLGDELA
jgi:signal transduction histidine kinase/ActR/RegA family two-component response regulator